MSEPSASSSTLLSTTDRRLLTALQARVPLEPRPFEVLGEELGLAEDEVLERCQRLSDQGIIRQVSAIFDTARLGYQSSLVAMAVDPDDLPQAAAIVSSHPGVSHNYRRDHDLNLWWTIAVPPDHDLAQHVGALHRLTGARSTRPLPTLTRYKLGVVLDVAGERSATARGDAEGAAAPEAATTASSTDAAEGIDPSEIPLVRELQDHLPLQRRPFAAMAERLGMTEARLLEAAVDLRERGVMRRFAAVLRHRRAGFSANAMSVWAVPEERVDEIGQELAGYEAVTHCYRRPTYPDWPYSLFAMIHATHPAEVDRAVADMRERVGEWDHRLLYSTEEYKKERVRYFDPAFEAWRDAHVAPGDDLPDSG